MFAQLWESSKCFALKAPRSSWLLVKFIISWSFYDSPTKYYDAMRQKCFFGRQQAFYRWKRTSDAQTEVWSRIIKDNYYGGWLWWTKMLYNRNVFSRLHSTRSKSNEKIIQVERVRRQCEFLLPQTDIVFCSFATTMIHQLTGFLSLAQQKTNWV
jgi:hypothetical protein